MPKHEISRYVCIGKYLIPSLYKLSCEVVAKNYKHLQQELQLFPPDIYMDILSGLYWRDLHIDLAKELCCLENLTKAMKAYSVRSALHRYFQAIMNLSFYTHLSRPSSSISTHFLSKFSEKCNSNQGVNESIAQGLSISSFLSEAGWYEESESILIEIRSYLLKSENPDGWLKLLECYQRLLLAQNGYCKFKASDQTYREALELISRLREKGHRPNLALLYTQFSAMFMLRSNYDQAFNWSLEALEYVGPNMHLPTVVDVLRQTSKSCVLKRDFKKAELLIRQAFIIAQGFGAENVVKYADTLIDYGFYFLSVDAISRGMQVYQAALESRKSAFGVNAKNLHLAMAYEDLAYASYVHNYSIGFFNDARNKAEKAMSLLNCLLPKHHFLMSSCKRVKALILEEMAIEITNKEIESKYLEEAYSLHSEALVLSLEAFGEMNVQTAKHYGNLGRLYQTMRDFKKAETMHLKAIQIKEDLLGPNDYEVALSVGHLASLYNYDLGCYSQAEKLYLRSIEIGRKLFGDAYSGLEYDYQGLLRVYANQSNIDKRLHYAFVLSNWKMMREQMKETENSPMMESIEPLELEETLRRFRTS